MTFEFCLVSESIPKMVVLIIWELFMVSYWRPRPVVKQATFLVSFCETERTFEIKSEATINYSTPTLINYLKTESKTTKYYLEKNYEHLATIINFEV